MLRQLFQSWNCTFEVVGVLLSSQEGSKRHRIITFRLGRLEEFQNIGLESHNIVEHQLKPGVHDVALLRKHAGQAVTAPLQAILADSEGHVALLDGDSVAVEPCQNVGVRDLVEDLEANISSNRAVLRRKNKMTVIAIFELKYALIQLISICTCQGIAKFETRLAIQASLDKLTPFHKATPT